MLRSFEPSRSLRAMALTGALALGTAACGGSAADIKDTPPAETPKAADDWRKQSLQLTVEGFMFQGAVQPSPAKWFGSGAWIGPDIAITNAHVALRATKIVGKDDLGKEYLFTQILAVDETADLAIIRAESSSESSLDLVPRPTDPKSLRGTNVRVIGNTGGLGLSFYDGRITNVVGDEGGAMLLHDANTAGGASGGPLIEVSSGNLVGVNHSSMPWLNAKGAAPSWIVQELKDKAANGKVLPFTEAFAVANMPVEWYVERAVCMKPGEMFKGVFASVATNDLVADVTPAQAGAPLGFILQGGNERMAEAVITGQAQGAWTLKGGGQYVYALLNPKGANAPACATVKFGRINWGQRLK